MSSRSETPLSTPPPSVSCRELLRPSGSKPFVTNDLKESFKHVVKFLSKAGFDNPSTTLKIPYNLYEDLWSKLEKHGRKPRCTYDHFSSIMTVLAPPSEIHESPSEFFMQIREAARKILKKHSTSQIRISAGGMPLKDVENPDKPGHWMEKQPDSVLEVHVGEEDPFSGLVLEVGYSLSYTKLLLATRQWLLGSGGKVKSVLLIKFEKPKLAEDFGNMKKWMGYLEVWVATEPVENGAIDQQIGISDLSTSGEETNSGNGSPTEEPSKDDGGLSDTEEPCFVSDRSPQTPNDSDESSSKPEPPSEAYVLSGDSDQSPEAINTEGITKSVDRLYFLRPDETVATPLIFELCIGDIIGKTTLPEIADQRLKVDLVCILEQVEYAIKTMARDQEQKKRKTSDHKNSNDAKAGPSTKRQKC